MITKRTDLTPNQNYTWIDVREIDKDDISILTDEYLISSELLADIMDADEQSILFCDYYGITKVRRGCPAGANCTRYAPKLSAEEVRHRLAKSWFVGERYGGKTEKPPET